MHPFSLQRAGDPVAAVAALASTPGARLLAGGTTLVDLMKLGVERPAALVDISGLPGLDRIEVDASGDLRIGALARMSDVADDARVKAGWPMVSEALWKGASAQLRNMATIGGNLLQRTRCPYFRDTAFERCNKRVPGSGCDALEGINREHALLGTSPVCIALHPSDLCVALAPLDAMVELLGRDGPRVLPFEDLHRLPADTPHLEHTLRPGELITAVVVPPVPGARRSTYVKVRDRQSYQFAVASAAVALDLGPDRTVREARVGLGGVATKPWRSRETEAFLAGKRIGETTALEAGRLAMTGAVPREHNAFKVPLMARTVADALLTLAREA
jgi:xanthine dehydrogenase YagS FAD-binding subunit